MKYRYIGNEQNLYLPKHNIFVKGKGDIIESKTEINHPDFERVSDIEPKKVESQKEEKKEEK